MRGMIKIRHVHVQICQNEPINLCKYHAPVKNVRKNLEQEIGRHPWSPRRPFRCINTSRHTDYDLILLHAEGDWTTGCCAYRGWAAGSGARLEVGEEL